MKLPSNVGGGKDTLSSLGAGVTGNTQNICVFIIFVHYMECILLLLCTGTRRFQQSQKHSQYKLNLNPKSGKC
jgi:hypothetical protein